MRVAVVGAGVVGLATTASLLDRLDKRPGHRPRGAAVTCYESVGPMSQRSAGQSRIFRLAHGSPELVELAEAARRIYRRWSEDLIRPSGTVVAGGDALEWAAAMAAAGAEHAVDEPRVTLPTKSIDAPYLFDPAGGVLDVVRIGALLQAMAGAAVVVDTVYRIEPAGHGVRVWSGGGRQDFDAVAIVAGAGTCPLAAQVGLYTPSTLAHHVRFTFPMSDPAARPSCLIDKSEAWQPGFTTYQHLVAPGQWAVGAHFGADAVAWELGRERVVAHSRRLTAEYVRENLNGVEDRIVDELYCNVMTSWGDGYGAVRTDSVVALYGDNLFKLAPVVGELLADAILTGSPVQGALEPDFQGSEHALREG
jgi:sarcosine oxidase